MPIDIKIVNAKPKLRKNNKSFGYKYSVSSWIVEGTFTTSECKCDPKDFECSITPDNPESMIFKISEMTAKVKEKIMETLNKQ